ncbi:MAG TPA: hypothetical protein VEH30_03230 [Terriglobales bacterium]|nr:hypothetical protein [Terriglobales bacterium]
MKHLAVVLLLAVVALGQNSTQTSPGSGGKQETASANAATAADLASQVPAPRAGDVDSKEAILHAIYDVISGPIGERDWNRFRSLFVPQARFTRAGKNPDGSVSVNLLGVDEFVQLAGNVFKSEAFYENAIVNQVQSYGNISQVFSSYESRHAPGEKPFERGVNSIQMLNDGKRWWVLSILWDEERPANPLPREFTKSKK